MTAYTFASDADRWAVVNALQVAIERYKHNAQLMSDHGHEEMAVQFDKQATDAVRIKTELVEL